MASSAPNAAALIESAKKAAAFQAVEDHLSPTDKFVGIGSGSTVVYVVEAIAAKGPSFSANMTFIPTGSQSKGLIRAAGLRLCNLDERPVVDGVSVALDVAFDGADEVDEDLNLIKGGGACLFQEKLVAVAAKKFIAVADSRKQSPRLCTKWKTIPIEVLPLAAPDVLNRLKAMGSPNPVVRSGLPSKAGECVTDNGMWIIDAPFPPLLLPKDLTAEVDGNGKNGAWEIGKLAEELVKLPGIVEIGLFHGFNGVQAVGLGKQFQAQKPVAAYFGTPSGEVQRTSTSKSDLYESRSLTTFDAIQSSTAAMLSRQVFRSLRAAAPQRAAALSIAPVRTFAAAAASEPKAPIAVFGLDGTYATALYTAASKTSTLDATAKELAKLGGILDKDAKLAGILSAPTLTPADKSAIVAELVKQAGASGATLKNFLDTLAENNRLGLLKGVTEKFGQIIAAARGEVEMTVTSAQALDPKTLSRLETAVAKSSYVGQGKKLKVTNAVNPEIVGGLIVEVGDRTIDLSVSARIAKMNKLLTDNL
ncbi:ribose 5-phosphate isomerase A (phosphoriboisomerase a) domain-containing protein [Trichoderma breve]|uniref:ATP synthase subunit 5, mitochondrial n=1 Tax=Trichoderma breve TaxID=2034170 RepID=A0A9W9E4Y1_9HYPO|nr:ribose 5-phosphate isomerase A (phosphoriboisomerase a) domain-containing protein [Trichoderma breve]KAJ4857510.1 ribose 5-phosphate isomerase A (phosphoriboisomerase a) domain-containing protein [Trichoderma breve]